MFKTIFKINFLDLGCSGELLYAKLMNDEILKCDKKLLKAAKQANAIGGKIAIKCLRMHLFE